MEQWVLEHSGGLAAIWTGGLLWLLAGGQRMGLGNRLLAGLALCGLLIGLGAAMLGMGLGPSPAAQWLAVAALIFARRPRPAAHTTPSITLSLLPLLLVAWQGLGAALAAVSIAGSGALDAGRTRRFFLLGSILAFAGAALVDDNSLQVWAALRRYAGLGLDSASTAVHLLEQGVRAAGWGLLLGWMGREQPER